MEFRLLYSGRVLGSSKNDTRADAKHAIRREFHPQLRRLWAANGKLAEQARIVGRLFIPRDPKFVGTVNEITNEDAFKAGIGYMASQWSRCGYKFVPLITEDLCLRCSIDILFLRPEERVMVMNSGDLDARIKTVFDSLRIPTNLHETGQIGPQEDEEPFFCLLEDDKLISDIRVVTDQLLVLPKEREMSPNDVFMVINVKLVPTITNAKNFPFW